MWAPSAGLFHAIKSNEGSMMKCHHCGTPFPANRAVRCSPGGQEAPGTFLIIAVPFIVAGLVLLALGVEIWPWVLLGIGGFVGLQIAVAHSDCSRSTCPACNEPAKIRPWSI